MKGSDIVDYTARFSDLVTLCPNMIPTESKKIERYIWGLVPAYQGNILALNPATFDSAKQLAQMLIDHEIPIPTTITTTRTVVSAPTKAADNKRKRWDLKTNGPNLLSVLD